MYSGLGQKDKIGVMLGCHDILWQEGTAGKDSESFPTALFQGAGSTQGVRRSSLCFSKQVACLSL